MVVVVGSDHKDYDLAGCRGRGEGDGVESEGFAKFGNPRMSLCHLSPRCQHYLSWTRWLARRLVMLSLCL